jgi:hypothetical protein
LEDKHAPAMQVEPLMDELRAKIRANLRTHLIERGGSSEFADRQLFDAVARLFEHGLALRERDGLLLPELLRDESEWRTDTPVRFSSHRRALGGLIVFTKRRLILPLTRWLYDFTHTRFERQHQVNRIVFALLEALAIENARLRRDLDTLRGTERGASPPRPG